jgi:hypothetical protein
MHLRFSIALPDLRCLGLTCLLGPSTDLVWSPDSVALCLTWLLGGAHGSGIVARFTRSYKGITCLSDPNNLDLT